MSLIFEWDESKNRLNIAKHGIDFVDVQEMFDLPLLTYPDDGDDYYYESRWIGIGWLKTILCMVVFSEPMDGRIRIISARKATRQEAEQYGRIITH